MLSEMTQLVHNYLVMYVEKHHMIS